MGVPFGAGQRLLFDAHQRFTRGGLKAFLRVKNFDEENPGDGTSTDYMEVGMPFAPTGAAAEDSGTLDYLISPPPGVEDMSFHNIGIMGGRYNIGTKIFTVSHTFVLDQLALLASAGITDPLSVWRDRDGKKVVGILYEDRIYAIDAITHKDEGGETINWQLVCKAPEGITT